jgi:DNA topoisomerase-1
VNAIEVVAKQLGNTRSVCRNCYVHPAVIDSYLDGSLPNSLSQTADDATAPSLSRLNSDESAVMAILERQSKIEVKRKAA